MELLINFKSKTFVEQIKILNQIENERLFEAIPELFTLCASHSKKRELQLITEQILKVLLLSCEEQTIEGLHSESKNIRLLCIETIMQTHSRNAGPQLIALLSKKPDPDEYQAIFKALCTIHSDETLSLLQAHITDSDDFLVSLIIEALGNFKDDKSVNAMIEIIQNFNQKKEYTLCELPVASAISALGKIGNETALSFLVKHIHAPNSVIRKFVHESLSDCGPQVIPFIKTVFHFNDYDEKIMAVNILGNIKDKKSVDLLIDVLDQTPIENINLRCAVYDALGKIPSMKSIIYLVDALEDKDFYVTTTVITTLNNHSTPEVLSKIELLLAQNDMHSKNIAKAIVVSKSTALFKLLYVKSRYNILLFTEIFNTKDMDIISTFMHEVSGHDKVQFENELKKRKIQSPSSMESELILAIDDSKSIVAFYRAVITELGYQLLVAENGAVGLELLYNNTSVSLIFVDMNMPQMNGIEFTQKVRKIADFQSIPIIMVTTESEDLQKEIARKAGVTDFVTKPFTAEIIQQRINQYIEKIHVDA